MEIFLNSNNRQKSPLFQSFILHMKHPTVRRGLFYHDDVVPNHHLCCLEISFVKKSTISFSFLTKLLVFIGSLLSSIFLAEALQYIVYTAVYAYFSFLVVYKLSGTVSTSIFEAMVEFFWYFFIFHILSVYFIDFLPK